MSHLPLSLPPPIELLRSGAVRTALLLIAGLASACGIGRPATEKQGPQSAHVVEQDLEDGAGGDGEGGNGGDGEGSGANGGAGDGGKDAHCKSGAVM